MGAGHVLSISILFIHGHLDPRSSPPGPNDARFVVFVGSRATECWKWRGSVSGSMTREGINWIHGWESGDEGWGGHQNGHENTEEHKSQTDRTAKHIINEESVLPVPNYFPGRCPNSFVPKAVRLDAFSSYFDPKTNLLYSFMHLVLVLYGINPQP